MVHELYRFPKCRGGLPFVHWALGYSCRNHLHNLDLV